MGRLAEHFGPVGLVESPNPEFPIHLCCAMYLGGTTVQQIHKVEA